MAVAIDADASDDFHELDKVFLEKPSLYFFPIPAEITVFRQTAMTITAMRVILSNSYQLA